MHPRFGWHRVRRARVGPIAAACLAVIVGVTAFAQTPNDTRPLPDLDAFKVEVRKRLRSDRLLQSQYTYVERREEIKVSKLGKVQAGPVKVYEVYPSAEPGNTYKRLISVDGVPLTPEELERNDRTHQRHVMERLSETPAAREKRQRKEAEDRRKEALAVDELFQLYEIRALGREQLDGHDMIVFSLTPRPGYRPRTDEGKVMARVRAKAWVSEADYQVTRVTFDVIEDITYGLGLLGRLYKGSTGMMARRRVNNEVWLPARVEIRIAGRALLVRKFAVDSVTTWSDYRKFKVDTDSTFQNPH
jgi:hypothetical protein